MQQATVRMRPPQRLKMASQAILLITMATMAAATQEQACYVTILDDITTVSCQRQHLTDIQRDLREMWPRDVNRLDLSYNNLTAVNMDFLRDYPELTTLDLSHNERLRVIEVDDNTADTISLRVLDLTDCVLDNFTNETLQGFTQLVDLKGLRAVVIQPGSFRNLGGLNHLEVTIDQPALQGDFFVGLSQMKKLDLVITLASQLPPSLLRGMNQLAGISITSPGILDGPSPGQLIGGFIPPEFFAPVPNLQSLTLQAHSSQLNWEFAGDLLALRALDLTLTDRVVRSPQSIFRRINTLGDLRHLRVAIATDEAVRPEAFEDLTHLERIDLDIRPSAEGLAATRSLRRLDALWGAGGENSSDGGLGEDASGGSLGEDASGENLGEDASGGSLGEDASGWDQGDDDDESYSDENSGEAPGPDFGWQKDPLWTSDWLFPTVTPGVITKGQGGGSTGNEAQSKDAAAGGSDGDFWVMVFVPVFVACVVLITIAVITSLRFRQKRDAYIVTIVPSDV